MSAKALTFVHVSDIHFGQEKGGEVVTHKDVKERLLEDLKAILKTMPGKVADGVIVTGDIAYGGKKGQYDEAAEWLDRLAAIAGCEITKIIVVPGNHDIDKDEISSSCEWMLAEILAKGEPRLDTFLANERDRSVLYGRFTAYVPFAEGYNCSMDCRGGLASDKTFDLSEKRQLQFIGLNSALICKHKDNPGELLLGARQRTLPITDGVELVVLSHHPLPWLQDSDDARKFVRSRARVFISGHEHQPKVDVENVEEGCDLMTLQAGATCPPHATGPYTYTYNVIEFALEDDKDRLKVTVHPRAWDDEHKRFDADSSPLQGKGPDFPLECPRFRAARLPPSGNDAPEAATEHALAIDTLVASPPKEEVAVPDDYAITLLRFFRDLTDGERIAILVHLNALPADWSEVSSHSLERQIFDSLAQADRLSDLQAAIKDQQEKRVDKESKK